MSRDEIRVKGIWVGAAIAIAGAGVFVARAVAGDRVEPVERRVSSVEGRVGVLENDQKRQDAITDRVEKKLDGVDAKLDILLRRTAR